MTYQVTHTTHYEYNQSVSLCHNIAKLLIRDTQAQRNKNSNIIISPQPDVLNEYTDYFGNRILYFAIQHEHRQLTVTVKSLVEKTTASGVMMNLYGSLVWEEARQMLLQPGVENFEARQYVPFTGITLANAAILDYALQSFTPGRTVYEAGFDLMNRIYNDFEFKPGFTTLSTPLHEVMAKRKGVCQDFAHLAIACVRAVGLPARYISGYLETKAPEGKEKLTGVDASHAWFSIFIPQLGWIEFDPTNNMIQGDQHLTVAWGRDYNDVAPLTGVILSSGPHELKVSVDVKRMH